MLQLIDHTTRLEGEKDHGRNVHTSLNFFSCCPELAAAGPKTRSRRVCVMVKKRRPLSHSQGQVRPCKVPVQAQEMADSESRFSGTTRAKKMKPKLQKKRNRGTQKWGRFWTPQAGPSKKNLSGKATAGAQKWGHFWPPLLGPGVPFFFAEIRSRNGAEHGHGWGGDGEGSSSVQKSLTVHCRR